MQNRKTRIAIIIEVKKRELPFFSILEEVLKKEGYEVKLISFRSMCTWHILCFRPDIIIVNGIRTTDPYFYGQIALPKYLFSARVVCYYSEQIGYYNESVARGYNNNTILDNVDFHVGWGPRFLEDLRTMGVPLEKLWYIGSLQYDIDLYHNENSATIKNKFSKKFGINKNKNWILYADNIVKRYQPEKLYEGRRLDSFNVIKKVAEENPDSLVIFRPHPDTSKEEMERIKKFFENNNNIIFNNKEHVYYWTLCSKAVIIWCSTSSIQAMFLGKPIFGFMTSDKQDMKKYWYRDILPLYDDYNQLANDVRQTLQGKVPTLESTTRTNRKKYVEDWYFAKDGCSFNRFVSLMRIVEKSNFVPIDKKQITFGIFTFVRILAVEIRSFIGDCVRRRIFSRIITRREINKEKKKYDLSRYKHMDFIVKQSESGKFFDL